MGSITKIEIKNPITKLEIGRKTYYLTAQLFYSGINPHVRKKIVEQCKWFIHNDLKPVPVFEKPICITIEIHNEQNTTQDLDNKAYFWCKIILDYLKSMGKIKDDNVKHVQKIIYEYKYLPANLVIYIEELSTQC